MKPLIPLVAAALASLSAACDGPSTDNRASPSAPVVRLPLVSGRPGVAYLSLPVQGDRGALVSVTSPRIGRIEMHETTRSGHMSSMRPLRRIPVNDGEDVRFEPGGRHLMLFDMDPALHAGDTIVLNFTFERGSPVSVAATVIALNDQAGH